VFNIIKHPLAGVAINRWRDFNISASANKLAIAVNGCGVRFRMRCIQEYFKEFRGCRIIVLAVTEKFIQILSQKPIEIADPIQPRRMDNHTEPRID
jgi:hypothetical protein